MNAHAIVTFLKDCRDRNAPEQFIITYLSSQPCEELFREMRSISTTNQTVVNFTIKEFTEKLKRIQMKSTIMYRNKNTIRYPALQRLQSKRDVLTSLPSDEDIQAAVMKAHSTAQEAMLGMGIFDIDMNASVFFTSDLKPLQTEFVSLEEYDGEMEEFESMAEMNSSLEMQVDEEISGNDSREPLETEFISMDYEDYSDESMGGGYLNEVNNLSTASLDNDSSSMEKNLEPIYDGTELFPDCNDSLNLKSSTVGAKHCFRIRNSKGDIKMIKKSTLLWMMVSGRNKLSTDRVKRFMQQQKSSLR